ncbi:unnamed protein product, partial [Pylaiella littoralis]
GRLLHEHCHDDLLLQLRQPKRRHRRRSSLVGHDNLPRCSHRQHTTMRSSRRASAAERSGAMMALSQRRMRRCRVSPVEAARSSKSSSSTGVAWESSGVSGDSGVDQTAVNAQARRTPNIRGEMMEILRPDLPRISLSVLWAALGTVAALAAPLSYAQIVAAIIDPASSPSRLTRAVALLGASYFVEPVATYLYVKVMSGVIDRAATGLKLRAFRSLLSQEVAFFDLKGSSELSAAVTSDVMVAKQAVQGNLQRDRGLRAVMETVCGLGVLVKLSPRLAWVFGLVIPFAAWGLAEARKKLSVLGQEEGKSLGFEASIASEAVRNIREVRGFGAEARELGRFQQASQKASETSVKMGAASGRLEALNRAAVYFSILSVMLVGGRLVMAAKMPAPLLLSFVGFCFSLNFAMQGVNFTVADAKRGQASLQRVFQVMQPPGPKSARPGVDVISPRDFEGKVVFRKLYFTYPTRPDMHVLSGLDLTLRAGEVTALVGNSGGGKSTIAALLSRFYEPSRGEILIDGVDVADLDKKWLTQRIALVGQNPALFTGTIAQNIAYGAAGAGIAAPPEGSGNGKRNGRDEKGLGGDVTMDRVVQAAELANAKDFVEDFPDGFDTFIGEGGVQLSGGQRQRIAIARAVLKDARILILDEATQATSALDAHSEALVQEALSRLTKGRTVLVIAHRLSTVVDADKICVLRDGKASSQ